MKWIQNWIILIQVILSFSTQNTSWKIRISGQKYPEVCLVMLINQGYLELHILAARNIPNNPGGLPDTYVKTYLKEGERRFLKKKSRLVVANRDPFFKHRVKYLASDLPRR